MFPGSQTRALFQGESNLPVHPIDLNALPHSRFPLEEGHILSAGGDALPIPLKHSERIWSVCGGHLLSINFPPRNEIGRDIMPTYRCKNPPIETPSWSTLVWFMINFASCFRIGKAHGWGTFPKCRCALRYCLVVGPLFWECPHPRALPYYTKLPALLPYTQNPFHFQFHRIKILSLWNGKVLWFRLLNQ
jgi:hypothetical protein